MTERPPATDWTQGKVIGNTHWTPNLFSLTIDADIAPFTAGQYTSLGLDLGDRFISDPYSILSAPGEKPLEFFFYTRLEGDLSTALARLETGDRVWVHRRPAGGFTLDNVPPGDTLWLLATGTGVAPFLSMLRTDQPWQRYRHVILVYAVRYRQDLRYTALLDELHLRYPGRFTFIPFVSREAVPGSLHGHIPSAIRDGTLERAGGELLHPESAQVMLCGNPGMVQDTVAVLHDRGFLSNTAERLGQLHYESYW